MSLFDLEKAEKTLCEKIRHGDKVSLAGCEGSKRIIRADVLRHIIVGLPLVKRGSETWAGKRPSGPSAVEGVCCSKTGVGIQVKGARIKGRLILDSAFNEESGPICPLEFENCFFEEGISGRYCHFSRLSLVGCIFGDPQADHGTTVPTIDLSGAAVDSDLGLARIRPFTQGMHRHHLWIRAIGTRIDGNLELSRARLRAPDDNPNRLLGEHRIQPLDLSLADVEGDLLFLKGDVGGTISARGAHIRGDVWMSGTRISCRPGDKMALFFQLARIGGGLMLDGRWAFGDGKKGSSDPRNVFRSFEADGELVLFGVRVGGSIVMNDIELKSKGENCIDLTGGRVGDRVEIGQREKAGPASIDGRIRLDRLEVGSFVSFENIQLGSETSGAKECHCIDARSLVAKHIIFRGVVPIDNGPIDPQHNLSITLANATLDHVELVGKIGHEVNLENAKIGGTLDISGLTIVGGGAELSLKDATIGGALRLAPRDSSSPGLFELRGEADLTGLSVDTLDDNIGRCWGKNALIKMDHFTYRRTVSLGREDEFKQSSYRIVADWIQSRFAESKWPSRWIPKLAKEEQFRRPWQLRRNWIYQQFDSDETRLAAANGFVSITRHRIRAHKYSPQPFEQAIRVARAEGREDFATHFEMQKQRLEWRFLNREVRWPLGFVAITLSSLWLVSHAPSDWSMGLTVGALAVTLVLMLSGSWIRDRICGPLVKFVQGFRHAWLLGLVIEIVLLALWVSHDGGAAWIFGFLAVSVAGIAYVILGTESAIVLSKPTGGGPKSHKKDAERVRAVSSKVLTWFIYWIPAIVLFSWTDWHETPFQFFVGFLVFSLIRLMAVFAHAFMRFGFGYLRRPIYAVTTLIAAFLVGWGGVAVANSRNMFVVAAEPTAGFAATVDPTNSTTDEPEARLPADREAASNNPANPANPHEEHLLMGSQAAAPRGFVRDVSCVHEISEPLYALDVLIPIVDLGEEHRCEIRRFPAPGRVPVSPSKLPLDRLAASIPDLPLDDNRFWWWMKAIYAIFGWIIVSLSILTFAQVNKVHAEPPHEHK